MISSKTSAWESSQQASPESNIPWLRRPLKYGNHTASLWILGHYGEVNAYPPSLSDAEVTGDRLFF